MELIQLVKDLRAKTGAGMIDCKKALTETNGDMEKAIDWLREKGIAKSASKSGRVAAEGLAQIRIENDKALIIELNSETDFVAENDRFKKAVALICDALMASDVNDVDSALKLVTPEGEVNALITNLTLAIGEKITLRRFQRIVKQPEQLFGSYIHRKDGKSGADGGHIAALAVVETSDPEVAKDVAMQVASMNPTYVDRNAMPAEVIQHEKDVQIEISKNDESFAKKPANIQEHIIDGRVSKALEELSLVDQVYFRDGATKMGQWLKDKNSKVISFVRYGVGEGIEQSDAAE